MQGEAERFGRLDAKPYRRACGLHFALARGVRDELGIHELFEADARGRAAHREALRARQRADACFEMLGVVFRGSARLGGPAHEGSNQPENVAHLVLEPRNGDAVLAFRAAQALGACRGLEPFVHGVVLVGFRVMQLVQAVIEREPGCPGECLQHEHVGCRRPSLVDPGAGDRRKGNAAADRHDDEAAREGRAVRMRAGSFIAMHVGNHGGLGGFDGQRRHAHDHLRANRLRNRIGLAPGGVVELLPARQHDRNAVHVAGLLREHCADANHFFLRSRRA